ncbi:AAA domain-containing protein [Chelativorans salis]|uniref:AAA domain-containing protein n=1 Tax=Chelativorans salis TaxID=2978478 RepID=A0ABT2LP77_9HYPH|nr:AAA domain-containing protein [Chelativorans sp. EGI FJ00035]MCT7376365.1 AAA domain-containing protein [Chelativorans sp. EGI FJ00035]
MTTRDDILHFLRDPSAFSATAADRDLWVEGLDTFANPSIARTGDRSLRLAQEAAWRGLADHRVGLVLGPPGTGKTHLLSWLITGFGALRTARQRPARTLVTAFTKSAVGNVLDAVARRQALHDPSAPDPIFYGAPPSGGVAAGVQLLGRGEEADVAQEIASGRTAIGATIWSLYRLIASGVLPAVDGPTAPLFDLVCIDEASQMVLGQGLMALAGMAPACRIVVSGDDQQLPPVRAMRSTRIDDREMGGSLYAFLKSAQAAEFPLEETFRLNAPLAKFPERKFYPGRYVSAAPDARLALHTHWRDGLDLVSRIALDPALPIVVLVHDGPAAATSNPFEANLAAKLTVELAERVETPNGPVPPVEFWSEIAAVVSPHRAQNAAIRGLMPAALKPDAFIETVDRIQGNERDAVILSYCVADPEFALAEAEFIFSPERLNVASTRARTKLVLIISRRLLEAAPGEQETMDKAELLREFVYSCDLVAETVLDGPAGRRIRTQVRARGFDGDILALDLTPDTETEQALPEMTPALEGLLSAIRRVAASNAYGTATLSQVRKAMALAAEPFADARVLHLLGWISLVERESRFGLFWQAKPFEVPRRVYATDIDTVRARIATVIREARSGKYCFYDQARDRFAWMSERGEDVLLSVVQALQAEGLLTLGAAGGAMTIAMTITAAEVEESIADEPLPPLADEDYRLLNRLEDIEAARINFGIFDSWTSTITLARDAQRSPEDTLGALSRLETNGHVMLAEDARVRSRIAEIARELRHVKQRFKIDDAADRPYLVRNLKVELRDRNKPVRNRPLRPVFDEAIAASTPSQAKALEGLYRALAGQWGEGAALADFQRKGLLEGLEAWRGEGSPSLAISADTGSGKTEAAVLPLIAGALGDALEGIAGVRAILAYPRIRLAANQAQRLAGYLAASASIPNLPLLTLGLQVSDVPDSFEEMHERYREAWRPAGSNSFEFPFFACPTCGRGLHLRVGDGHHGVDALVCTTGDWRYDGWIGSKALLRTRPPSLFLPTTDSLHQWLHDPRYGALFGDDPRFSPPRAMLADEIHLYTHIHGAQVGMALRRLAGRAETSGRDTRPMVAIGMSATISDPAEAWGRLIGRDTVRTIRPEAAELDPNPRGREVFYFIQPEVESRGADIAGASTTIQSLMCIGHGMRRRTGTEGGYRGLVFFDSIDKMRRLHGAYVDAEEGKELASLRISDYGDDANGQPQTQCCREPIGCDRFADGECWWFAANDQRQCGADGRRVPATPLRVAHTPIYSGTSSDAEAVVKGSDIVFATSSLEVGYDDPDITFVYQHYAPQNLASFIQRKGRGGRGVDDRPTTAVTLSIYSPRDSWYFRRPAEMISPAGFRIPLNPDNYFVRRGQALTTLLDGLARSVARGGHLNPGTAPTREMLDGAGALVEAVLGRGIWAEFGVGDAQSFWAAAIAAQPTLSARYLNELRRGLRWAPDLLFDTINLPALTVEGPNVVGGRGEDIGLALAAIAPGNATRRYNSSIVHWCPPVHGRAPWLTTADYGQAERQPLRSDSEALLAELPVDVRDTLAGLHSDLCRPIVATLERMGWMAGAHWAAEVGCASDRNSSIVPLDPHSIPLRHDSSASLRGFLLVTAEPTRGREIAGASVPGIAGVSAFTGDDIAGADSGLNVARVFWGADAELRFDRRGVDPLSLSQIFIDPETERPLLHGYQVTTEGLRFTIDRQTLERCVDQTITEFAEGEGRLPWHEAQFLRYLIESRSRAIGIAGHDARLGADIIAAAAAHTTFAPLLRRLARFWSPAALKTLFQTVREQLLSQHPLMTAARVERAADMLGVDAFHAIFSEAVREVRDPEALRAYFISVILHSLTLRLKFLVTQVGQGDERQLLAHVKLPLQFGADAESSITICEAGAHGDGTVRGVVDNWHSLDALIGAGYLGTCPNADEDSLVRRFWSMPERHEAWRQADPRDATALAAIAAELAPEAESLPPVVVRVLFAQEAIEAEPFALYDIAAEIEDVRVRAFGDTDQPVLGWELAAAAVHAAGAGTAPVLRRLFDAYDALDPNAEGSLTPAARLAEQVFRLAAPLCADGCRSCVHQPSDLMSDSLAEASVSRSLLQRFLASVS